MNKKSRKYKINKININNSINHLCNSILKFIKDAVIITDIDGIIEYWNKSAEHIFGFKRDEVVGKYIWDTIIPDEYINSVIEEFKQLKKTGISKVFDKTIELKAKKKDGTTIPVEYLVSTIRIGGNHYVLAIIRDISEEIKLKKELEDLKGLYQLIIENINDIIFLIDKNGYILYISPSAERLSGYTPKEAVGRHFLEIVHPEDRKKFSEVFKRRFTGYIGLHEYRIITKDGKIKYFQSTSKPIYKNGELIGLAGVIRDITDKKEIEERFRSLVENANDGIYILTDDGFEYVNPKLEEIIGYPFDELKHRGITGILSIIHPEDREFIIERYRARIKGKSLPEKYEFRVITRNGEIKTLEASTVPLDPKGKKFRVMGIIRDITEKKKLENELRESEEKFRMLAEKSLVGIYLIQDGVFKYVNPKLAEILGYEVSELIGKSNLDVTHPEDRELVRRNMDLRIKGIVDSINYKFRIVRKNCEVRTVEVFGSRILYNGKPAIIGTLIDRTDDERIRRKLEEYKRFYENAQDIFFIIDKDGDVVEVNPKCTQILGYSREEIIGKSCEQFINPNDREIVKKNISKVLNGKNVEYLVRIIAKNGKEYVMDAKMWPVIQNGEIIGAEGILRDITEKKELEERIRESEEKYRKIFERSPNIVTIIDDKGRFIEANPTMIKCIGFDPVGKNIYEVFSKDLSEKWTEFLKIIFDAKKMITFEDKIKNKHFLVTLVPLEISGKRLCLAIMSDLTRIIRSNKLLNAVNKASSALIYEKNKIELIRKICKELTKSLEDYSIAIGLINDQLIDIITANSKRIRIDLKESVMDCVRSAIISRDVTIRDSCISCPLYPINAELTCVTIPMLFGKHVIGVIIVLSKVGRLFDEEIEILKSLANDLTLAIKSIEIEKDKNIAYEQIKRSLKLFMDLVDGIRNPLTAILGYIEMKDKLIDIFEQLTHQVGRISKIIEEVDRFWEESERIRKILERKI